MDDPKVGVASKNNPAVSHELSDVNVRGVLYFAVGLTILAIVIHVAIWVFYAYFAGRPTRTISIPQEPTTTPAVSKAQLQVEPESELSQLRASEEQILHSYGWVDREKRIVRIPIERAMEIIAREGQSKKGQAPAKTKRSPEKQ